MENKKFSKLNIANKLLSIVPKLLYDMLIIFCVILIVIIVWQRITDSNQSVYGYRLFRVVSGSMVPEYNVGEVVVCKDIEPKEIEIGDVIVYRGQVGELTNRLVMHEVVSIDQNEFGVLQFHVKGIQNTAGDPDVSASQILGVVTHTSGILTLLYSLATSIYSSFIIITILVINVFIAFRPTRKVKKLSEHNENHQEELEEITKNEENDLKENIQVNNKEDSKENNITIKEEILTENEQKLQEENKKLQEENHKLQEKLKKNKEKLKKEKIKNENLIKEKTIEVQTTKNTEKDKKDDIEVEENNKENIEKKEKNKGKKKNEK